MWQKSNIAEYFVGSSDTWLSQHYAGEFFHSAQTGKMVRVNEKMDGSKYSRIIKYK